MRIKIPITKEECREAAMVGIMRRIISVDQGCFDNKRVDTSWETDVEGAIGELIIAKWLNIKWKKGINTFHDPDVADIQVRTTKYDTGRLIVRNDDSDNEIFVLVAGTYPSYYVCGWMYGKDAKKPEWIFNPNGRGEAWFVPQRFLQDPVALKEVNKKS